jgi:hypothetical protein
MSNRPRNFCHTFSPDYTEIRCVKLHNSQIYSNTSNTVTSWYRQKIYTQKRTTG